MNTPSIPFRLYVISDRSRMGTDPAGAVASLAAGGLRAFQWREKDLTPRENLGHLLRLSERLIREGASGFSLFINDRADLALASGTNLHLAETSIPTRRARLLLPAGTLIGRSTHSVEGAMTAARSGADFITFGPIYDTASKQIYGRPSGLKALREVCRAVYVPVFAIGGITGEKIEPCLAAGAAGIAVIGAIWGAPDPGETLDELLQAVGETHA
jgi:thiamine-phosphate pyrophosphorylase